MKVFLGPPSHLNIRNPIHLNILQLHLNMRTGISYYLRGLAVWPALHIFKCRYRTYMSKQCNNRWCNSMRSCYECKVYLFQWIHFLVQDVRQVRTKWTNTSIIKWWILRSSSIYFRTPVPGECLCNLTRQCAFHHFCRMLDSIEPLSSIAM